MSALTGGQQCYTENQGVKVNYILSRTLAIFSNSYLLKHWRGAYLLDVHSAILVSGFNLIKNWRGTNKLNACSASVVPA